MSTASKRRARREARGSHTAPAEPARTAAGPPPLAQWRWRTFPVFAALALGGFIGANVAGTVVSVSPGNLAIVLIAFAIPLGFAMSRLMSRFMMTRGWVKPRPRRGL